MGACCGNEDPVQMRKDRKKQIASMQSGISDADAWRQVNELWQKKGLKKTDALDMEEARPFITSYVQNALNQQHVDEGTITQIFNEIDEDGNQSLDRQEMFNFIKNTNFTAPNEPAKILKKKTKSMAQLEDGTNPLAKGARLTVYDDAKRRVAAASIEIGTLKFKMPKAQN